MGARQALVIGVALVALAGCTGGGDDKADSGDAAPTPSAAPLATYSGDAANAKTYMKGLLALDADLVDDEQVAISNGVHTCEEASQGKSVAQMAQSAATRFEVDATTAQRIVVITTANLCK